ncbi:unnamed protein product [Paramecium octaurelia]|uniref:Uncharacterized protein n=1 Tax=Paramecium octaurelia TaxID=43137 RepID=A0A8S1XGJ6_PAROT|nr:unnamed protein product [Paramecium octaurelia]
MKSEQNKSFVASFNFAVQFPTIFKSFKPNLKFNQKQIFLKKLFWFVELPAQLKFPFSESNLIYCRTILKQFQIYLVKKIFPLEASQIFKFILIAIIKDLANLEFLLQKYFFNCHVTFILDNIKTLLLQGLIIIKIIQIYQILILIELEMQMRCNQADHRNQSIIGVCVDITCPNIRPYCNFCLSFHSKHLHMLTPFDLINEWIQERILQAQDVQKNVHEFKFSIDNLLIQFSPYCNFNIDQIPKLGLSQIDKLVKSLGLIQECEKMLFRQLDQSIQQVQQIVLEILKTLKNQTNIIKNDIIQISYTTGQFIQEQPKNQDILKPNISPISYEIMNKNSIKQKEFSLAVAVNKECSIVAAGCEKLIKIYEFGLGTLRQIQILNKHQVDVTTLYLMKKSNQLISGDKLGTILIWLSDNNNEWICSSTLLKHNDRINCLIMNNDEDIIISSSSDYTIKFWVKQIEWVCLQTITDHKDCVYQLSLNDKQNKVISCGCDQLILVIEYSQFYEQWMVIQTIKVDCYGYRLCFINDHLFTFQPKKSNVMYIYDMNNESNQFKQTKHIAVNQGQDNTIFFPKQYIKSKQLLVCKHGRYINLIRMTDNHQFTVEQSIQFDSDMLFGYMTDDGQYLITWDISSKEIQIRRTIQQ